MSSTKLDTVYSWPFKNVGTSSIPAFGAMRVTGHERDEVQGLFLTVEPPDDTEDDPVAINSGVAVGNGRWGVCFFPQASWAKVEEATEHGDSLGAEKDKEGLVKGGGDYTQIGEKDTDLDAVLVSIVGGAKAKAKVSARLFGAIAIVKGTVPAASGIDVSGNLVEGAKPDQTGKQAIVYGELAADINYTTGVFTAGALLLDQEGRALLEPDPLWEPAPCCPAKGYGGFFNGDEGGVPGGGGGGGGGGGFAIIGLTMLGGEFDLLYALGAAAGYALLSMATFGDCEGDELPADDPACLPDLHPAVRTAVNCSYTDFVGGEDGVAVQGAIYEWGEVDEEGEPIIDAFGYATYNQKFIIGWPDFRAMEKVGDGDIDIIFTEDGESFKRGAGPCEEEA